MCSSRVSAEKVQIWATFTLVGVAGLSLLLPSVSWLELRKGDILEEQSISRWRKNAILDINPYAAAQSKIDG